MLKHNKMCDLSELLEKLEQKKKNNAKIVFTNGCFDIIHPGHVDLLARAKALGDILVLALNTDDSVKRQGKAPNRPINSYDTRAFVLSHLEAVDYVVPFDEDTPYNLIAQIQPNILVKGGDWAIDKIVGNDIVKANGGEVHSLALIDGYSTTNIINIITR